MQRKNIIITSLVACAIALVVLVWAFIDGETNPQYTLQQRSFDTVYTIVVLLMLACILFINLSRGPKRTINKLNSVFRNELKGVGANGKKSVFMEFTIKNGEIVSFHKGSALGETAETKEEYVNFLKEF